MDGINYLSLQPAELTIRIAHFLDPKSLVAFSHTSRYIRSLSTEEGLWKELCRAAWSDKVHMPPRLHTLANYEHLRHRVTAAELESILARRGVNCNDLDFAERAVARYEEYAEKKRQRREAAAAAAQTNDRETRQNAAAAAAAAARRRFGHGFGYGYGYGRRRGFDEDEDELTPAAEAKDYGYINYSGKDLNDDVDPGIGDDIDLSDEYDDDDEEDDIEEEYGFTARHRHFLNRARLARRRALKQKAKEDAKRKRTGEDGDEENDGHGPEKPALEKGDSGVDVGFISHEDARAKAEARHAKLFDLVTRTGPVYEIVSVKWPSKWQQTYWTALEDGKRQMITYEELISLKWRYSTGGESWDTMHSRCSIVEFRRDHTRGCVNITDHWPQDQSFRYRDNYIQVASFPEHEVRRRDDWGWTFYNPWVEYISIDEKHLKQKEDGTWYVDEGQRKKRKHNRTEIAEEQSTEADGDVSGQPVGPAHAIPGTVGTIPASMILPLLAFFPGAWIDQSEQTD